MDHELSVTPVFDAVLPAEMTNVDSNDSQTSPDSERLLQIGYVPLTHQVVQAHACLYCSMSHRIKEGRVGAPNGGGKFRAVFSLSRNNFCESGCV